MQDLFGTMTMIFAIAMVFVGLTAQVIKNAREKRCGNPLTLIVLALAVYLSRTGYAITIESYYILIPDMAGSLLGFISLFQWFYYRNSK